MSVATDTPETYETQDVSLASFLRSLGVPLHGVRRVGPARLAFQFRRYHTLERDLADYAADRVRVSPRRYARALSELRAVVRGALGQVEEEAAR